MNTVGISTSGAGAHVLTRPINDGGAKPVDHLIIDGKVVKVGEEFEPTRYWCGRNHRLLERQWVYEYTTDEKGKTELSDEGPTRETKDRFVKAKLVAPYVVPVAQLHRAKLEKAVAEDDHKGLGESLAHFTDEVPAKKEERIIVARAILAAK